MDPDFNFETIYWDKGLKVVAGCDEVGRGSFAGPVVTAVTIFSAQKTAPESIVIRDSKKMTSIQRKHSYSWIKENSLYCGIGIVGVSLINKIGIKKATDTAFRKAVINSNIKIDKLLIDAFYIPYINGIKKADQHPIIKGDSISFSIASASIVAKVERDTLMEKIGMKKEFQKYDWINNKGYGTLKHREAILKHGVTKYHRTQFVETFMRKQK